MTWYIRHWLAISPLILFPFLAFFRPLCKPLFDGLASLMIELSFAIHPRDLLSPYERQFHPVKELP